MLLTDRPKQSIWPRTPMFRSLSSFSISSKTLSSVKSATITFTVFPVLAAGEKWKGGAGISNSRALESCSLMWCHPVRWVSFYLFLWPPCPDGLCFCLWWPRSSRVEPAVGSRDATRARKIAEMHSQYKRNESTKTKCIWPNRKIKSHQRISNPRW